MNYELTKAKEINNKSLKAVVINNSWYEIAPLFENLKRHGIEVIKAYSHQREVIADLEKGEFPQADVVLSEEALPRWTDEFQDMVNLYPLVRRIRQAGVETPIIVVATFAFSKGIQGDIDDVYLEQGGVVVDREKFRMLSQPPISLKISRMYYCRKPNIKAPIFYFFELPRLIFQ